jgi:hypothetical protein
MKGGKVMHKFIILLIALIIFTVNPVWAGGEGRYQATWMGGTTPVVLILDTEKGHFWIVREHYRVKYGGKLSTDMKKGGIRRFNKKE